jgi:hypothetical protein
MSQSAAPAARRMSGLINLLPAGLLRGEHARPWLALLTLVVLVGLVHGPTVNLAFYEEDPSDFGESRDRSLVELFSISTSELYYRPVHLAFFQLMSVPFGYDPRPAHLMRLGIHVANGFLLYLLLQRIWKQPLVGLIAAALMAIHPMGVHGLVRLTASQVPLTLGTLGTLLLYVEARLRDSKLAWGLSVLAMALTLLVQETAVVILPIALLLEFYLVRTKRVARFDWKLLAVFALEVIGFLALWFQVEKTGTGFLEESFSLGAAIYLLQAAVYPFVRLLAMLVVEPSLGLVAATCALGLAALGAWYALRGRALDFALLLAIYVGVLIPPWAAKEYGYFLIGERTLYAALPWAVALWAGLLLDPVAIRRGILTLRSGGFAPARGVPTTLASDGSHGTSVGAQHAVPLLQRNAAIMHWVAPVMLAALATLSIFDSRSLIRLHLVGSDLMSQIVDAEREADDTGHLLFVNVPDRFKYQRPPYPIGDWGMLVAPASMDLSRYGALRYGTAPETESLTAWGLAAGDVEQTPYWVTTRGPNSSPEALYESSRRADEVYLVAYRPSAFELRSVGTVLPAQDISGEALATFGDAVQLLDGNSNVMDGALHLTLHWRSIVPPNPDDTIFVHVAGPDFVPAAQADGDALGGLLPLSTWQPDDIIEDRRAVSGLPPGEYVVIVGLYNRSTGERLEVTSGVEVVPGGVEVGQVDISG